MKGLHRQQQSNTCAVAAVRTVLDLQYGKNIDEPILEAFGSRAKFQIREQGARTTELRRMLRLASETYNATQNRWRLRVRVGGTKRQLQSWLDRGCYPLLSMYQEGSRELHMIVVVGLSPSLIQVFDPDLGTIIDLPWQLFSDEDWAEGHWYAVVHDGTV